MADSDSENEVFFRDTEVTDHQFSPVQQNDQENGDFADADRSRSVGRGDQDEGVADRQNIGTSRSQSTNLEKAVQDMLTMQSRMTQALSKVSDFLVQQANNNTANERNDTNGNNRDPDYRRPRGYRGMNRARGDNFDDSDYDDWYGPSPREQTSHRRHSNVKFSAFTGKDDWNVWINRFEAIAERQNWDNEEKLDNLLPKLEGTAGEFVYTQLQPHVLRNYDKLVAEIHSRFRVIVTPKTFAAKFSKRDQRPHETAEEYAAELKCLYNKAHRSRDSRTREEDLLRRFFDGLRNKEISWEVEFIKEPTNIDEAVYHVVSWIQTRQRLQTDRNDRRGNTVRRIDDHEEDGLENREDHAYRVPTKLDENNDKTGTGVETESTDSQPNKQASAENEMLLQILDKITELATASRNPSVRQQDNKHGRRRTLICYACKQENHFARDCPNKQQHSRQIHYDEYRGPPQMNPNAIPYQQPLNFKGPA